MARLNVLKSFYGSAAWQNFRLVIIAERGLKCEHCGRLIANPIEVILHHKIELTPENIHDVNISLNPTNILLVCRDCHDKIHGRFGYQKSKAVFIVYGCPLSGKRTYVSQNIVRGDILISIDSIFEAITGLPAYDKPDSLLINVRSVYNLLIDQVKTRYGKWNNAYIIGGFADRYKREPLTDDLGAELIYCECTKEEAISRIDQDERRRNMKTDYIRYIEEWFEQYSI